MAKGMSNRGARVELERLADQVFVVRSAFSDEECAALIERAEQVGFADAPITTSDGPKLMKRVRNNDRAMIDDVDLAAAFWERLGAYAPQTLYGMHAVGVNERFRFYRYHPGQSFRWHVDGAYVRPTGERSQYTMMLYLNDDFEGGCTDFRECQVVPERGMAAFFYHHQRHRGAPVTSGVKYVIRTDEMYSDPSLNELA